MLVCEAAVLVPLQPLVIALYPVAFTFCLQENLTFRLTSHLLLN